MVKGIVHGLKTHSKIVGHTNIKYTIHFTNGKSKRVNLNMALLQEQNSLDIIKYIMNELEETWDSTMEKVNNLVIDDIKYDFCMIA